MGDCRSGREGVSHVLHASPIGAGSRSSPSPRSGVPWCIGAQNYLNGLSDQSLSIKIPGSARRHASRRRHMAPASCFRPRVNWQPFAELLYTWSHVFTRADQQADFRLGGAKKPDFKPVLDGREPSVAGRCAAWVYVTTRERAGAARRARPPGRGSRGAPAPAATARAPLSRRRAECRASRCRRS